jgi:pyruvate carboxylase subunit B
MPGLVVRVEVQLGQHVAPGTGLVVVEAMKMENELRAQTRGIVAQIHVQAGDRVEKGTPLVTLAQPQS